MHDYLARLIGRATATAEVVRPLSVPRFARAAVHAPGETLRAIDEGAVEESSRDRSSPPDGETDSMRVVARVASMDEGEAPRARAPRRSPERTRAIDGLRPDGRSSDADASPEPLASSTLRASEARVARSSDRGLGADVADPAGDPSERRRRVVATRVADGVRADGESRFADGSRFEDGFRFGDGSRFDEETRFDRDGEGMPAPADAREESRVSRTSGRVGRDEHPAEDARRMRAPAEAGGARVESALERPSAEPVRIAIGRIEVRIATKERPDEHAGNRQGSPAPLVSLDDYLARQGRQGRGGR